MLRRLRTQRAELPRGPLRLVWVRRELLAAELVLAVLLDRPAVLLGLLPAALLPVLAALLLAALLRTALLLAVLLLTALLLAVLLLSCLWPRVWSNKEATRSG